MDCQVGSLLVAANLALSNLKVKADVSKCRHADGMSKLAKPARASLDCRILKTPCLQRLNRLAQK
jgi:hypothetical protein